MFEWDLAASKMEAGLAHYGAVAPWKTHTHTPHLTPYLRSTVITARLRKSELVSGSSVHVTTTMIQPQTNQIPLRNLVDELGVLYRLAVGAQCHNPVDPNMKVLCETQL